MTRLEYYSNRIIIVVVFMIVILSGLITSTIILKQPVIATTPQPLVANIPHASLATSTPLPAPEEIDTSSFITTPVAKIPDITPQVSYVMVTNSCSYNFAGDCVRVRSAPGLDARVVGKVRNGMVLRADTENPIIKDGLTWYKIRFDEVLRYPERVTSAWYISSEFTIPFTTTGPQRLTADTPTTTKRIIVDRSEQSLRAYENDILFLDITISTGRELTPTPRGEFTIYYKTPSRYMQGPLPGISDKHYDLPGVPWNLYFTNEGAVVHGAYWHNSFGSQYSNGCVNVPLEYTRELYEWADLGTKVIVHD